MVFAMRCARKRKMTMFMTMRHGIAVDSNNLVADNGRRNDDVDKLLGQKMPFKAGGKTLDGKSNNVGKVYLFDNFKRAMEKVRDLMRDAIQMKKTKAPDVTINNLCEEYLKLDWENRKRALLVFSSQFGVDRQRVLDLLDHYKALSLEANDENDAAETALYRTEHELRAALMPLSAQLFDQMNGQTGGLKFLVDLRADLLNSIKEHNLASLRALDKELKGLFATWLGPACLELTQISWTSSAALLEKIVVYEAVHPISDLYDLKRRLGAGRRCYGYFHPAIPGEPRVFIEVALSKHMISSIQNVLLEEPPVRDVDASTAIFYAISSTQPGLSGIDLGHFLIKNVVSVVQRELPNIQTFATLSPIPGFMNWLFPKLEMQIKYSTSETSESSERSDPVSTSFKETVLLPSEESNLLNVQMAHKQGMSAIQILHGLLKSPEWANSEELMEVLRPILMRLCARYLLVEKKRGRALDRVANFHIGNGAAVERLNWMADRSPFGLKSSAGIMVNYMYRLDTLESCNRAYVSQGVIAASPSMEKCLLSHL